MPNPPSIKLERKQAQARVAKERADKKAAIDSVLSALPELVQHEIMKQQGIPPGMGMFARRLSFF